MYTRMCVWCMLGASVGVTSDMHLSAHGIWTVGGHVLCVCVCVCVSAMPPHGGSMGALGSNHHRWEGDLSSLMTELQC